MEELDLNVEQRKAIRLMMDAVVTRHEAAVADMLAHRAYPERVYAAPATDFWIWADDYAGKRLNLVMPPGEVEDWGLWGF